MALTLSLPSILSIFLLLFVPIHGFFNTAQMQEELNEIIPSEARNFYESLNDTDRKVLQNVLSKSSTYENVSQVLSDLKNGSKPLYDKAVGVVTGLRSTIASLGKSARQFVDDTAQQAKDALNGPYTLTKLRSEANAVIERYTALDEETKEELKNAFPMVSTIVYNNVFQTLAGGMLGIGST
jgi:hypothetical protein